MERPSFTRHDTDAVLDEDKKAYRMTTRAGNNDYNESMSKAQEAGVIELPPAYQSSDSEANIGEGEIKNLNTAEDIVTTVIHVDDDPTLNPWTFRMFFIG